MRLVAIVLVFVLGFVFGCLQPLAPSPMQAGEGPVKARVEFKLTETGHTTPTLEVHVYMPTETKPTLTGYMIPVLELNVYGPDGKLTNSYRKVGDPPTANFIKFIMHAWWFTTGVIQIINGTWTAEDGSSSTPSGNVHGAQYTAVAGINYISLKVVLGNGTTPPAITDHKLANKLVEFPVTWYCFDANSTHMWLKVKGVYTHAEASPLNFTEVGLAVYAQDAIGAYEKWMLLFRDVIPEVSLDKDQSIEVRYYIYMRYA